jgi:hypothetical protein
MISADVLVGGSWVINPGDGDVPSSVEMKRMEGEGEKPQMGADGANNTN